MSVQKNSFQEIQVELNEFRDYDLVNLRVWAEPRDGGSERTALSVMAAGWRPIWACGSLSALTAFPVLSSIECLTIFADPKPHEIAGARTCAARWAEAGREVYIRVPSRGDWNDILGIAA
jgi:hypothetical protein